MNRTTIVLLLIAVSLAGCSGAVDGTVTPTGEPTGQTTSTTTANSTPATTALPTEETAEPSTPTPTATATPSGPPVDASILPPGAAVDGLNASTITERHKAALRNGTTYSVPFEYEADGQEYSVTITMTSRIDLAADKVVSTASINDSYARGKMDYDIYAHDGVEFQRTKSGERTEYSRVRNGTSAEKLTDQLAGDAVRDVIQRFAFTPTATKRVNGSLRIAYTSTTVEASSATTGDGLLAQTSLAAGSSATLVIDESGVVRSVAVDGTSESEQEIEFFIAYTDIGSTTVEEPDWVETARAETTPVPE